MPTENAGATKEEFVNDAKGNAARWATEFEASRKELRPWHAQGEKVVARYLDKANGKGDRKFERRLNLLTSNTQMLMAILYGKTPLVDVSRKFADATDEIARVAGEIQERLLNGDIEKDSDTYAHVVQLCLEDRLLPGMSCARARYVCDMDKPEEGANEKEAIMGEPDPMTGQAQELAPAVPTVPKKTYECVEIDYVPWKDQLYSPSKTFLDMRWWAFKTQLDREALKKKFGDEVGGKLPLNAKGVGRNKDDTARADPWARADVWEIWDKERKCVWWLVEGYPETLVPVECEGNEDGSVQDTLGLQGFWPFPRPMIANATTSGFVPVPDFAIAQDLYNQIDDLETRIYIIQKAIAVRGVYDGSAGDSIERLLDEGADNLLIPVKNWMAFMEKGGLNAVVQFMPIEMLVEALQGLRDIQAEKMRQLDQVTGMGDVIRGQANTVGTTATENKIKGMFASVRVQTLQDDFARFCSDLQKIKAEIISLHFDPNTILEESNIMNTPDAQFAQQAVELIKSKFYQFRIQVKPEAVSLTDFAAQQGERQAFIQGMAGYFTAAAPMAQQMPGATGFLLEIAQWYAAAFKASSTVQGIFDRAIAAAKQAQQQQAAQPPQAQQPDPKLLAQQAKNQGELQKIQLQTQSEMSRQHDETQQLQLRQQNEAQANIQEELARARIRHAEKVASPPPMPGGTQ